MSYVLPILGMICTAITTLMAVVFCMGMGANASVRQIRMLKVWMAGLTLLGITGVVVAIYLLQGGQPGRASIAAFAPSVVMGVIFVVSLLK